MLRKQTDRKMEGRNFIPKIFVETKFIFLLVSEAAAWKFHYSLEKKAQRVCDWIPFLTFQPLSYDGNPTTNHCGWALRDCNSPLFPPICMQPQLARRKRVTHRFCLVFVFPVSRFPLTGAAFGHQTCVSPSLAPRFSTFAPVISAAAMQWQYLLGAVVW